MESILSDSSKFKPYVVDKRCKKNPFIFEEDKLNRKLIEFQKKGYFDKSVLSKIKSTGSQPARLYGLPKVHKNNTDPPYRPILNMKNSYKTDLSEYLCKILKTYLPSTYVLKDTFQFVEELKGFEFKSRQSIEMCSFDVINLFGNIPISRTIDHILTLIDFDHFELSRVALKEMLHLACTNVIFSFNDKLYSQFDGMAMGSKLGPTMAAFAMNMIESNFENFSGSKPLLYKRYVDDCFCIFHSKTDIENFFKFINSLDDNLQFTVEYENNKSLRFLDTTVFIDQDQIRIRFSFKNTNTGMYIPSSALAPFSYKMAAFRALFYRAFRICSHKFLYEQATEEILNFSRMNGYADSVILKLKDEVEQKLLNNGHTDRQEVKFVNWNIPFISKGVNELKNRIHFINKALPENTKIRLIFKTSKTLHMCQNVDTISSELKSKIVYVYSCDRCNMRYVGVTIRHLAIRINEHVTGKPLPTEISMHVHRPLKENFSVIGRSRFPKILETILIRDNFDALSNERSGSHPLRLNL